jgi:hypothetical protein
MSSCRLSLARSQAEQLTVTQRQRIPALQPVDDHLAQRDVAIQCRRFDRMSDGDFVIDRKTMPRGSTPQAVSRPAMKIQWFVVKRVQEWHLQCQAATGS